jgi:hypothetical protein
MMVWSVRIHVLTLTNGKGIMTATTSTSESGTSNDKRPDAYPELDKRLLILETRFDIILPNLATKSDLAELKGELKGDFANLRVDNERLRGEVTASLAHLRAEMHAQAANTHKWLAGTCIVLMLGIGGMSLTLFNAINAMQSNQAAHIDRPR